MIQFNCQKCGRALKANDNSAGRRGKCKFCSEPITVPAPTLLTPAQPPARTTSTPGPKLDVHNQVYGYSTPPPTEVIPVEPQIASISPKPKQGTLRGFVEKFSTDEQDPKVVERVQGRIRDILMSDEELLYIAVQNKPLVNIAPDCIVLTNKRFIIYRPTIIGRVSFEDYVWRELSDAKLAEGIMGATISILTASGKRLSIDYLPKPQGRQIYRVAQEQEEKALAERRTRGLEESRAAAGGVVIQTAVGNPGGAHESQQLASNSNQDPVATLKKLKMMLDEGLITHEEYENKKNEIVSRM